MCIHCSLASCIGDAIHGVGPYGKYQTISLGNSTIVEIQALPSPPPPHTQEDTHFRYFILDNSIVVGLMEEPFIEGEGEVGGGGGAEY